MTPEQELDLLMAEPTETNAVVRFIIGYPDSPKTYGYAAILAGAKWYLTGPDSPQAVSWQRLVSWLKAKNAIIVNFQQPAYMEDIL